MIYFNDISNALNSTPRLFADDTCIINHQSNQAAVTEETNRELANVHKWTQANKITGNSQKSSSSIIPPKTTNNTCDIEISFDNSIRALQDSVKYLGNTIDSGLKFNLHYEALESKIARPIGVISNVEQVLPVSALRTLYYSTIHPHLLYGIVSWGSTFKTYLGKLSVLQNKALRIIAGGNWLDNATQYYAKLNDLKLDDLYKFEIAKLMHQLVNNKLPQQFYLFLVTPIKVIHTRTTRLASKAHGLYISRFRTKRLHNSFKHQGVKIWHLVPENLQKLPFNRLK